MLSLAAVFEFYAEKAQQLPKMATGEEKALGVLQFNSNHSVITVERHFRTKDAPCANSIRLWYAQFKPTGCLWIGRGMDDDQKLMSWPPRSADLTPCDFYMGIYERFSVCASFTSRPTITASSHHQCLSTS